MMGLRVPVAADTDLEQPPPPPVSAVLQRPWLVLAAWLIAILLGAWGAHRLPQVTLGVEGGVPGSPSRLAAETLRSEFNNPFIDPLVVAVSSPHLKVDAAPYLAWVAETGHALATVPGVRRVANYADERDVRLRSTDGRVTTLLVGLTALTHSGRQQAVIAVRGALAPRTAELTRLDPGARVAVTGNAAADLDVNTWSAAGGDRAETRALPLTLAILLLAFGTVFAAGLPFLTGLATTTVSLGIAFLLAQVMPVSNLLGNVVTMLGLAIGIDYSLLMVTYYRESAAGSVAHGVTAAMARGGRTIAWSGVTVIIGLLALLLSPILETRSVGIGGALVVCVSVLAALTLLPVALMLLGQRIDWLPVMPHRNSSRPRLIAFWRRLGGWVVRHPYITLLVAGSAALALAAPVLRINTGFANERWFLPPGMESRVGADLLAEVRGGNAMSVIYVLVRTTGGQPLLAPPHLEPLVHYGVTLTRDPRVGDVSSPVNLQKELSLDEYRDFYADLEGALREYPEIADRFLSRDG